MLSFAYSLFLKLLYPTSVSALLVLAAALLRKREKLSRILLWSAFAVLMLCGNGWLVRAMTRHLEWQNRPANPVPSADCILILSGGIAARISPRPTVEVNEAGDRVIYGAHLFKQGKAPRIFCTGNVATGGIALRPVAEEMAEFLENLGVPKNSIVTETGSEDTHQHGSNLQKIFREQSIKRVLLVTSAMHMPRSLGVFRRSCPDVVFIPAPADFRVTERIPAPWYRELTALVPTPANLLLFSEAMHEYLGLAYYKLRGWA